MAETQQSKPYSLNWLDAGKGLIVAVLTAVLFAIQAAITAGTFDLSARTGRMVGLAALSAGVGYLIKNFFTGPAKEETSN